MAGTHPDELTLLDLVEGDLPRERVAAVSAHVEGCAGCAETVQRLEGGRAALRASPLLELPAERREALLARLPERERPRAAARFSRRRLVAVLAPVAAAAVAAVAVLVVGNPTAGDERAGEAAEVVAPEAAGEDAGAPAVTSEVSVRTVRGPAAEVAALLQAEGFDAQVVEGAVRVESARRAAVERALSERPDGPVPVIVVP